MQISEKQIKAAVTAMAQQDITFANCDASWQKRTIRAALESALSAAEPPVAVKPLRWKGPNSYGEYHSLGGLWGYIIRCEDDGHWLTEVGEYFPSPEAAQKAAQADYEARILSALTAQVQDVVGLEAKEKTAFNHGYVIACCNVVNLHDEPGIAHDTLRELGITKAEVKMMDLSEYDTKALREIERARGPKCAIYKAAAPAKQEGCV